MNGHLTKLQGSLFFACRDVLDVHSAACNESPLAAMLLLPMIAELRRLEDRVKEMQEALK